MKNKYDPKDQQQQKQQRDPQQQQKQGGWDPKQKQNQNIPSQNQPGKPFQKPNLPKDKDTHK